MCGGVKERVEVVAAVEAVVEVTVVAAEGDAAAAVVAVVAAAVVGTVEGIANSNLQDRSDGIVVKDGVAMVVTTPTTAVAVVAQGIPFIKDI